MEQLKEVTLKVKVDSYKDLQNYLNNELKITKADIEEMVSKYVEAVIKKQLLDDGLLNQRIDKAVKESISRLSSTHNWNLETRIDSVIEKALGQKILDIVKDQLKDFKISVSK